MAAEEEILAAKKDMSERQFRQEFLATFETYENRVAWSSNKEQNVVDLPQDIDTAIIHVGMDFNVNPATATVAVKLNDDAMLQIDELNIYSSNTDEICDEILNRYPRSKIFVYPYPAGHQRKTSANGNTDIKILENRGFIVKAPRRHDAVKDRINAANARLKNAEGVVNYLITKNCKHTIESLDKHTFKEGTGIPDKDSGYDHMFDALSYKLAFLYPIKKAQNNQNQPVRWGVAVS